LDFTTINKIYIQQKGSGRYIAAFDLTYLRKAGKSTEGAGKCGAARAVIGS
jgi:hypothetical protein